MAETPQQPDDERDEAGEQPDETAEQADEAAERPAGEATEEADEATERPAGEAEASTAPPAGVAAESGTDEPEVAPWSSARICTSRSEATCPICHPASRARRSSSSRSTSLSE